MFLSFFLQVNTVQQPSHVSLIWKCRAGCSDHVLTACTGGIFPSRLTQEVSTLFKKAMADKEREGESQSPAPSPKSLIQTSLISIHRHRVSSIIRLNRESDLAVQSLSRSFISQKKKKRRDINWSFFFFLKDAGRARARESTGWRE